MNSLESAVKEMKELLQGTYWCQKCGYIWEGEWNQQTHCPECNADKYRIWWKNKGFICWNWL